MEKRYGRNSSFLLGLYAKRTFLTMFILQNGIDVFVQFVGNVSAHDGCNDDQRFVHLLILRVLVVNAREKRFVISSLYRHYFKNTLICSQLVWCFIFHRGKYNDDTPIYAPIYNNCDNNCLKVFSTFHHRKSNTQRLIVVVLVTLSNTRTSMNKLRTKFPIERLKKNS